MFWPSVPAQNDWYRNLATGILFGLNWTFFRNWELFWVFFAGSGPWKMPMGSFVGSFRSSTHLLYFRVWRILYFPLLVWAGLRCRRMWGWRLFVIFLFAWGFALRIITQLLDGFNGFLSKTNFIHCNSGNVFQIWILWGKWAHWCNYNQFFFFSLLNLLFTTAAYNNILSAVDTRGRNTGFAWRIKMKTLVFTLLKTLRGDLVGLSVNLLEVLCCSRWIWV